MANFVIPMKGVESNNFLPSRILRKGIFLSSYMFLLVMEGLIRALNVAKIQNGIKGIQFGEQVSATHMLFVDDVLIFRGDSKEGHREVKDILDKFCKETRMESILVSHILIFKENMNIN